MKFPYNKSWRISGEILWMTNTVSQSLRDGGQSFRLPAWPFRERIFPGTNSRTLNLYQRWRRIMGAQDGNFFGNQLHLLTFLHLLWNTWMLFLFFSFDSKNYIPFALSSSLLMVAVQNMYGVFEGRPGNLIFSYNQQALSVKKYYTAGKLVAWSIMHNGPGPKCLNVQLYELMCGQHPDLTSVHTDLFMDEEISTNVAKVMWKILREYCIVEQQWL